jgi:hypothetical protein
MFYFSFFQLGWHHNHHPSSAPHQSLFFKRGKRIQRRNAGAINQTLHKTLFKSKVCKTYSRNLY